jgi:hypothetical protein
VTSPCTIAVEDADAADQFALTVEASGIQQTFDFSGGSFQKDLMPNDDGYEFALTKGGAAFPLIDPPAGSVLDLFDPTVLRFRRPSLGRSLDDTGRVAAPAGIEIPPISAPNLAVQVRNASTGDTATHIAGPMTGARWIPLPPGRYVAEITERGRVVRTADVTLAPGERKVVDLFGPSASRVQASIAATIPRSDGLPDASESLRGPLVDQDTSMWLTILGASRLIDQPSNFSKLGPLPLATFDDLAQGDSVVYALAGLESGDRASIAIGTSADVDWQPMERVQRLSGVFQRRDRRQPGPVLISFAIPGMPPTTYASYALPNRAVLIVFDVKRSRQIVTRQMLLPVYSLQKYLDAIVLEQFNYERLALVKYLTIAQELFANRQSIDPGTPEDKSRWDSLLFGKWIDPLLGLMAIFDAARRGRVAGERAMLATAMMNLNQYFGELPDVSAAGQILGMPSRAPAGTPLLLESLQRVPDFKNTLPLKADFLDYDSMWTSWWAAVKPPA